MHYEKAVKILKNRKYYTEEQIKEAHKFYKHVTRWTCCCICGAYRQGTFKPCFQCLCHYSTNIAHYEDYSQEKCEQLARERGHWPKKQRSD